MFTKQKLIVLQEIVSVNPYFKNTTSFITCTLKNKKNKIEILNPNSETKQQKIRQNVISKATQLNLQKKKQHKKSLLFIIKKKKLLGKIEAKKH